MLSSLQMEEMAQGAHGSGHLFSWLLRRDKEEEGEEMVVPWCSQAEVPSHPSIGCFVTHCDWNSTSESLARGVRMEAFPQWTDQQTNAMLIEN
ncbi:hypothetical protein NL676_021653 [Syzygium grande]|nr:hypothetical protein NL676_021653 [Syzygium grande]